VSFLFGYILVLAMIRARWKRQEAMPLFTWRRVMGGEMQVSVCVIWLQVYTNFKSSVILPVEEGVQE